MDPGFRHCGPKSTCFRVVRSSQAGWRSRSWRTLRQRLRESRLRHYLWPARVRGNLPRKVIPPNWTRQFFSPRSRVNQRLPPAFGFTCRGGAESGADYRVSLPLCASALKAVHRAANRLVFTEAHVTFARIEARLGRVHLARRHIALASNLLKETPNLWLDASARLTNAIVFSVQGDLQTACELAEAAGWMRLKPAGLKVRQWQPRTWGDTFHACAGRVAESKRYIEVANRVGYLPPSYACALLDTRTFIAFRDGNFDEADRLWTEGQAAVNQVAYWLWLRCAHTKSQDSLGRVALARR